MSFRLSMSSGGPGGSPELAVRRLVKAGFRYAELGSGHSAILLERGEEGWKKFRAFAEGEGLSFRQGHLPLHNDITLADESLRCANVAIHRAYCRMYHALGITAAVLHCGGYDVLKPGGDSSRREEVRARRVKSLEALLADLPEGMSICLENLPYETFEDVDANLAALGYSEQLGFCLDTGHLNFCPRPDPVDFIRRAGKRLKALHLHDNAGPMSPDGVLGIPGWLGSDKHMFPGFFTGSVNWYGVTAALREVGYGGLWNLEVEADLRGNLIPDSAWRDMVLRQDRERAELLFSFDPDAPAPGDPVNDYQAIAPVSSGRVTAAAEKFALKITTPVYELKVDPVHGGRIVAWHAFGRDFVENSRFFGWGLPGGWAPARSAFLIGGGLKIDGVKALKEGGVEITHGKTLSEADDTLLSGVSFHLTDTFTEEGFRRECRVTNSGTADSAPFAFRFHCLPAILGGKSLPLGEIRFADGRLLKRPLAPFLIRINGLSDPVIESPFQSQGIFFDSDCTDLVFSAPGMPGELEVSFPGEKPAAVCFWESPSGSSTFEPIFKLRTLAPGESCAFSLAVKLLRR